MLEPRADRSFRSHPSALSEIRRWIREQAGETPLTPTLTEELLIAVNEACTNSVLHSGESRVDVAWMEGDHAVQVEVRDGGTFRVGPMAGGLEETGRGIPVMLAAADEIEIVKGTDTYPGTVVRLRKRKPPTP